VRELEIDRVGAHRPDFDSPLAQAHDVHATPSFRVFSPSGEQIADGEKAKDMVRRWYHDAQLIERGRQMPGLLDQYRAR
jgi:hypothetical protein